MQITTLIPAYKPKYLVELLIALRNQTVKPARIIISDDSPDQAFRSMILSEPISSAVADLNIDVVQGPCSGPSRNFHSLLQAFREQGGTELFHMQLDDDIPYPTFYERHLQAHDGRDIRCAVSRRWTASETGQPLRDLPLPRAIQQSAHRLISLDSKLLFEHTVGLSSNWLGEYSNATFRAEMAVELDDLSLAGISFAGLEDLGAFLKASLGRPVAFINEPLGYFRLSANQRSADSMGHPLKMAHLAYVALAIAGRELNQISAEHCATVLGSLCPIVESRYGQQEDMSAICALMPALARGEEGAEAAFLAQWKIQCRS